MRRRGGWVLLFALLAGNGCAVGGPAPSSIALQPLETSLEPGAEGDFTADLGALGFLQSVRWSVDPLELGTIDAKGHFTAGPRSGTGSITASAGGASATAKITISCPAAKEVSEVRFTVRCGPRLDMYFDSRVDESDMDAIVEIAETDASALESHFSREYGTRGLIYVFADRTSYLAGIRRIFGERTVDEATETDAFFAPWVDAIAVNWGEASLQRPSTALRHELTHRMVWRISGYEERPLRFNGLDKEPPRIVPTWLDEGLAMLEETRTPGAAWMATLTHVSAAVAARRGRFRLRDLTDLEKWNARSGDDGAYEYYFATETVRLLESDIGRRGIVDILERIRKGANLSTAYRAVTGFGLDGFEAVLSKRLLQGVTLPGVVSAPYGEHSAMLFMYGFTAGQVVTFTMSGPAALTESDRMDSFGGYISFLSTGQPAGTYKVTATGGGADPKATYTVVKTLD